MNRLRGRTGDVPSRRRSRRRAGPILLALSIAGSAELLGAATSRAGDTVGVREPLLLETPHPYGSVRPLAGRTLWRGEISRPGSSYLAVHFSRFELDLGDA